MPFLSENGRPVLVSEVEHKEICALLAERKIPHVDFSKLYGSTSLIQILFKIDNEADWAAACALCSALIR
jgi:hypothetical protein